MLCCALPFVTSASVAVEASLAAREGGTEISYMLTSIDSLSSQSSTKHVIDLVSLDFHVLRVSCIQSNVVLSPISVQDFFPDIDCWPPLGAEKEAAASRR